MYFFCVLCVICEHLKDHSISFIGSISIFPLRTKFVCAIHFVAKNILLLTFITNQLMITTGTYDHLTRLYLKPNRKFPGQIKAQYISSNFFDRTTFKVSNKNDESYSDLIKIKSFNGCMP